MYIKREVQSLVEEKMFKGKVIVIYGARRVGKTTLVSAIFEKYPSDSVFLSGDEPDVKQALTDKTSTELRHFIGPKKLVVIDEAQRIRNIGLTLKLLVDNYPDMQIIATGSSSFDLSNEIPEPLTGRMFEFKLYPFSLRELEAQYSRLEIGRLIEIHLRYGLYPEVIESSGMEKEELITSIAQSYLFKDILEFERLKNPELLVKLVQALGLQLGQEVSYNELANLLQVNKVTVERYIQILEKAFVVFRLPPFSRHPRREIGKMRKIYFYDVGIRNALINNFNPLNLRNDVGALWENFCMVERLKANQINRQRVMSFFWRSYRGGEIDYLEEKGGKLEAFEFKWKKDKAKIPREFKELHPQSKVTVVHRENIWTLL